MFGGSTSGWGFLLFVLPIAAILTQYTITGYDASAHLSEETKSAANGGGQGHLAVDLLLGHRRLDPAAVLPVRGPGRPTRVDGRRRGGDGIFTQAMEFQVGRDHPVHLHGRPVLLHHGLPDQRVAHAVRVQPRPRGARSPAVVDAERQGSPPTASWSPRCSRRSSRCPRWSRSTSTARPFRRVLRGGVDRRRRACTCASPCRSTTGGRQATRSSSGSWNLRRPLEVDGAGRASIEIIVTSIVAHVPDVDRAACRGTRASSGSSSTTPRCWWAAC